MILATGRLAECVKELEEYKKEERGEGLDLAGIKNSKKGMEV